MTLSFVLSVTYTLSVSFADSSPRQNGLAPLSSAVYGTASL